MKNKQLDEVRALLAAQADVTYRVSGWTVLHWAAYAFESDDQQAMKPFLKGDAHVIRHEARPSPHMTCRCSRKFRNCGKHVPEERLLARFRTDKQNVKTTSDILSTMNFD